MKNEKKNTHHRIWKAFGCTRDRFRARVDYCKNKITEEELAVPMTMLEKALSRRMEKG